MIQRIFIVSVCLLTAVQLSEAQSVPERWNDLLDKVYQSYIVDGRVDYKGLSNNSKDLHELNAIMRTMDSLEGSGKKAFLINAYNLIVLTEITRRWPVKSVKDIPGFFAKFEHEVGPGRYTLDELEDRIFKEFQDPRIHLVLICGARGCPPFWPGAFRSHQIEEELDRACEYALNDSDFIRTSDGKTRISRIFDWFSRDFGGGEGIRRFILNYRSQLEGTLSPLRFYPYDWSVNQIRMTDASLLRVYTPSFLLSPGQYNFKFFNNLYTQTSYFDEAGNRTSAGRRSTFYTGILEASFGLGKKVNIGFDAYFRSVHYSGEEQSPFSVFSFGNSMSRKTYFTHLGPTFKVQPIADIPSLSTEMTWLFPLTSGLEDDPFLESDGHQGVLQVFYDRNIGHTAQIFVEWAIWNRFDEAFVLNESSLQIPLKVFGNFFIKNGWTVYLSNEINASPGDGRLFDSWYMQSGLGTKILMGNRLELELLFTDFWLGKNSGAGMTYNLGFRYIGG